MDTKSKKFKKLFPRFSYFSYFSYTALVLCASLWAFAAFAAAPPPAALSIQKLAFVDEIVGLGQYKPRGGANFKPGDTCTIYVEVAGFSTPPIEGAEGEYDMNLAADMAVKTANGRYVASQANMTGQAGKIYSQLPVNFMGFAFSIEGWNGGSYVLEIGVRDNLSGQVVSRDLPLQVVKEEK